MTRIGVNPARGKRSAYRPARVTVAVLTWIPSLDGYFHQRLEILKLSLNSLLAHTSQPRDLMVMDNGSCPEVVAYLTDLHQRGAIDYLLLSRRNLGKIGAFQVLFHAAPGEIVAYSDDDILYYPDWLEAHLRILDVYPRAGMVSGIPVRDASDRARQSLMKWVAERPDGLERLRDYPLPDAWEEDWALSTGRDPQAHLEDIRGQEEWVLRYRGVTAYGSASHFQFVAPKEVLQRALPEAWSGDLMGRMIELDEAVDRLGYLRLSTVERYTRHIGNAISADLAVEVQEMGLSVTPQFPSLTRKQHWLLKVPGSGRLFRWLYHQLFVILHQGR